LITTPIQGILFGKYLVGNAHPLVQLQEATIKDINLLRLAVKNTQPTGLHGYILMGNFRNIS
jgi:hypothetical protein